MVDYNLFHKKLPGIIQLSGPGSFFWRYRAFEAVKASEIAEADEVNEAAEVLRPDHYWGLQSHPGS